ncbi:endonuclease domain-containing protein [Frondihabitans cladoniiphilus]
MKPRQLPPHLRGRPFSVEEALAAGETPGRLRSRDLATPYHGARAPAEARTTLERCRAFAPLLREGQALSHSTAAELWELPVPPGPRQAATIHVTATLGREPRRPGIIGHREKNLPITIAHGLPIVEPIHAFIQCAALLPLDDLVAMGDALVGRWSSFDEACQQPRARVEEAVRDFTGGRGSRRLSAAMALVRVGCWSPQETALRLLLQRAGLPEPELNSACCDGLGRFLGRPDIVYRWARVAVEYEGDHHRTDADVFQQDIERRERFADAGWRTIRVTKADLYSRPEEVVARVKRALGRRVSN